MSLSWSKCSNCSPLGPRSTEMRSGDLSKRVRISFINGFVDDSHCLPAEGSIF